MPRRRRLPPDPEELNERRAAWAAEAIIRFREVTRTDVNDALADLLADLKHWCDRNHTHFDTELRRARRMYIEETQAGEPMPPPPPPVTRLDGTAVPPPPAAPIRRAGVILMPETPPPYLEPPF